MSTDHNLSHFSWTLVQGSPLPLWERDRVRGPSVELEL